MNLAPISSQDVKNVVDLAGGAIATFLRRRRALFDDEIEPAFRAFLAMHRNFVDALVHVDFFAGEYLATEGEYLKQASDEYRILNAFHETITRARISGQSDRALIYAKAEELQMHLSELLKKSYWSPKRRRKYKAAHAFATACLEYFREGNVYRHDLGKLEADLRMYTRNPGERPTAIPWSPAGRQAHANAPIYRHRKSYEIARYVRTSCQNARDARDASWLKVVVSYLAVERLYR